MTWIIAADGGGTACRFRLFDSADAAPPREITLGPANVFSDFDGALGVIRAGLTRLCDLARADIAEMPVYLGLAGVVDAPVAGRVRAAVPSPRVWVEEDWQPALTGALGEADGAIAGFGTGSFLARQSRGCGRKLGGHGFLLGDEGSGAWLGREALARSLQAAEGLRADTDLAAALRNAHGGAGGILRFAAAHGGDPGAFAVLAPQIAAAADAGDPLARDLFGAGAAYLARGLTALGWVPGEPLCLTGGLAASYARHLPPRLRAALRPPLAGALDGAERRARRLVAEGAPA